MNKYLLTAVEIALKAGKFLRRKFTQPKKIGYKGEINLVTDSDLKAEDIIITSIKKAFPNHEILSEETLSKYKARREGFLWVIDPLDGTTNFAHGYPLFGVSIALVVNSTIMVGVAYNPVLDELFTAKKGKAAHLNNKKIHVSKTSKLINSLLATGFPYDIRRNSKTSILYSNRFLLKSQGVRRDGSAVMNLCYLACGRFDGFWELKLKPWDTAAGCLIVESAGGKVTDFKGGKYDIYKKEILATNGLIHNEMLKVF